MTRQIELARGIVATVETDLDAVNGWLDRSAPAPIAPVGSPAAATISVVAHPEAPARCFLPYEYYQLVRWSSRSTAVVSVNGAAGTISEYFGKDGFRAELSVSPAGVPESLGVFLRLITALALIPRGAVVAHCSSVVVREHAHLFLGASGAGKTTTARRLGREGGLRVADDMAIVSWDECQGGAVVEASPFDRASRLAGRRGQSWPLASVYAIQKGAAATRLEPTAPPGFSTWLGATVAPPLPEPEARAFLDAVVRVARRHAPKRLAIQPRGAIMPALADDGATPRERDG